MPSKRGSTSSGPSRRFDGGLAAPLIAIVLLAALSAGALVFTSRQGWTLWYGDALAHLNIARRIVDSRTPGFEQTGTVWLPLPHWLMVPFVGREEMWRNGMAGALPAAGAYVLAGWFLFLALRRLCGTAAAFGGLAVFALNPNLLYLQSTPMTEPLMLACWMAVLWTTVRFRDTQSKVDVVGAGLAALAGTLTRYEGWFFVPFAALYILLVSKRHRFQNVGLFSSIAGMGPLFWLAYNSYYHSNWLEFYNGPYSAKAIYQRALDQGMARYPGDHDWAKAVQYYFGAVRNILRWPLIVVASAGLVGAVWRRAFWPLVLLMLGPVFYLWSLYSSATPIFVPELWPHSWYNTRYAIGALPLAAFGVAALVRLWRPPLLAPVVVAAVMAIWCVGASPEAWICWKESQVNSAGRRTWTHQAAAFMAGWYRPGDGILTSFGDLAGVFLEAEIPLRETLHEGNGPAWLGATARPDLMLFEHWAICQSGDRVSTAISKTRRSGQHWERVKMIAEKNSPVIEIWRRQP